MSRGQIPQSAPPCPASAVKLRNTNHRATCSCSADMVHGGRVWGNGPYTDDSNICRAAVHAGVIPPSGGPVAFAVVPGRPSFTGRTRNGITSSAYGTCSALEVMRIPISTALGGRGAAGSLRAGRN
ncbi:MAG: LCCL domain-containing protein [Pseudomonadota bacterium]